MKKLYLSLLIVITCCIQLFAEPNYKGGNGTIIFSSKENGVEKTIRKCEVKNIKIGDLLEEKNRDIYSDYNFSNKIGKLKDNDIINVLEVCKIEYTDKPKNKWNYSCGEIWFKISMGDITGCICKNSEYIYPDPYCNNNYEVLEEITTSKKWTVRRLDDQVVSVWRDVNIYDKPETENTKVIYTISPGNTDNYQTNLDVIAITEEKDTIQDTTDYWLKVKYKDYEGWIFGGNATIERGGPRYYIPEAIVRFALTWY